LQRLRTVPEGIELATYIKEIYQRSWRNHQAIEHHEKRTEKEIADIWIELEQQNEKFKIQISETMRDEIYDQIKNYNIGMTRRFKEFKKTMDVKLGDYDTKMSDIIDKF
jgi:hypothetical protein